jgi:hypothetical protein
MKIESEPISYQRHDEHTKQLGSQIFWRALSMVIEKREMAGLVLLGTRPWCYTSTKKNLQ